MPKRSAGLDVECDDSVAAEDLRPAAGLALLANALALAHATAYAG